jgi:fructuronate reductase
MIDKITPHPSGQVEKRLTALGLAGMDITRTDKNTYVAPFVNAEETEYLVIEDSFPNGRPPLEKAGLIFTDAETVNNIEKMKVGACLNPLHSALAVFGCVLGYKYIHDEMRNKALVNLIRRIGYDEALPYVPDPGIIRPKDFLDQVVEVRLPNPYIPDTPQRIAMDTSHKIPIRFGGTLKKMAELGESASALVAFPFFFAGWLRYLLGIDDTGEAFEISPDPMLSELRGILHGIKLGDTGPFDEKLRPILSNKAIFGVNLYENGLAAKTEEYFSQMISGPGAVESKLNKYFGG